MNMHLSIPELRFALQISQTQKIAKSLFCIQNLHMDIIFQKKKNGLEIYLLVLEIPSKQTFLPFFLNTLCQVRKLLYDVAQYCKKNWLISHTQTHKSMFGGSNLNVVDIVGYFLFLTTVILPAPVIKCTGKFHLELLASLVVCGSGRNYRNNNERRCIAGVHSKYCYQAGLSSTNFSESHSMLGTGRQKK